MRVCGSSAPSANSRMGWLHEFQGRRTVAHGPRSGRSRISNDDVARLENAFQENP